MNPHNIIAQLQQCISSAGDYQQVAQYILSNLDALDNLSEGNFMKENLISQKFLQDFLQILGVGAFRDLVTELKKCHAVNLDLQTQHQPTSALRLFHNQIINSLELNFQAMVKQATNLEIIITKIKKASNLYFFTNKNSAKIVEDFGSNLTNLGFKVTVMIDLVKITEKSHNLHDKDLFFYIFDDSKNRALANVAEQLASPQQQIIISKIHHHHLSKIASLQYGIDYSYFRNLPMVNTRKIILMIALDIIFQKIVTSITDNYQKIVEQIQES